MVSTRSTRSNRIKEESLEIPPKSSLKFRNSKDKPIKEQQQQVKRSCDKKVVQKDDIINSTKYKIGYGGFANIYKAKSKLFARKQLVLKELMEDGKVSTESLEFIYHTKMKHVNVVQAHSSYDTNNNKPVLILDYCEKGDLHDYLTGKGFPQTVPRSMSYIRMIAEGINYIQSKWSIIHMDIKCENILVSGLDIAKICDFGCVVEMTNGYRDVLTKHNGYTKLYVPKEFLQDKEFDSTADVWSLAVVAFELIFECHPFFPNCSCSLSSESKSCMHDQVALKYMNEALEKDGNYGKFASFDKDVQKKFEDQNFELKHFFNSIFGVPRINRPLSSNVSKLPWIKWK